MSIPVTGMAWTWRGSTSILPLRLRLRRKSVFQVRFLSDKDTYTEDKANNAKENVEKTNVHKQTMKSHSNTEKIQQLLKSMMKASKDKETASRVSISTPPGLFKKKPNGDIIEKKEEKIEEKMTAAVSQVAAALGGDTKKTEAELLSRVLGDVTQGPTNLSELVMGMKIDRSKEQSDGGFVTETRGEQVRRLVERAPQRARPTRYDKPAMTRRETISAGTAQKVDISCEKPLGIFKPLEAEDLPRLETWQRLQRREAALAVAQPPRNYFEKMLLWTEQGKVWQFPIDNEQGMEEEAKVHFTEHVFVEQHLEGWCPERGPIRHFMELVCVGLSKNPFYTAREKRDHIVWFKDYFESKKDLLSEIGALGDSKTGGDAKST